MVTVAKVPATPSVKPGVKKQGKTGTTTIIPVLVGSIGGGKGIGSGGKKISASAAAKISKTVSRQHPSLHVPSSPSDTSQHVSFTPLVVSLPLSLTMKPHHEVNSQPVIQCQSPVPSKDAQSSHVMPKQALCDSNIASMAAASTQPTSSSSSNESSSASSCSSSTNDDSEDMPSDSNSGAEDEEPMETNSIGPVPMVTTIANSKSNSGQLVRPKAITSPIKPPPPLVPASGVSDITSPALSPLTSPRGQTGTFSWTNRPKDSNSAPSSFVPIAPPLSSPSSSLPFPSLSKHSLASAFHVVSSKPLPVVSDSSK